MPAGLYVDGISCVLFDQNALAYFIKMTPVSWFVPHEITVLGPPFVSLRNDRWGPGDEMLSVAVWGNFVAVGLRNAVCGDSLVSR